MSLLPIEKGRRERSVTQTNLWLRHLADTIATSEPNITEAELSSRWRELPWPRRQEIWRSSHLLPPHCLPPRTGKYYRSTNTTPVQFVFA